MNKSQSSGASVRLAEIVAALSLATDLGMGQPLEYALNCCVLSLRLGEGLGLDETELREVYYLTLLRHIGCNAETYRMAEVIGDELALRAELAAVDLGQTSRVVGVVMRYIRQANAGVSPLRLAGVIAQELVSFPKVMKQEYAGFCEAARLDFRL